jgi:hypothetical protein
MGCLLTVNRRWRLRKGLGCSVAAPAEKEDATPPYPKNLPTKNRTERSSERSSVLRFLGSGRGFFERILCVFITAVPNTKLCAWGEEDSGGHVL